MTPDRKHEKNIGKNIGKNILDGDGGVLPFVVLRQILDYRPNLPLLHPCFWETIAHHYYDRICGRCGEFKANARLPRIKKFFCLCHRRRYRWQARPRFRVTIRPRILCRVSDARLIRTTGILHSMPSSLYRSMMELGIGRPDLITEHLYFVLSRQPEFVYSFVESVRFFEKCSTLAYRARQCARRLWYRIVLISLGLSKIETVTNMCNNVVCTTLPPQHHPVGVPFRVPVRHLYPFECTVNDLPSDYPSEIMRVFQERMSTVHDPLFLL